MLTSSKEKKKADKDCDQPLRGKIRHIPSELSPDFSGIRRDSLAIFRW